MDIKLLTQMKIQKKCVKNLNKYFLPVFSLKKQTLNENIEVNGFIRQSKTKTIESLITRKTLTGISKK